MISGRLTMKLKILGRQTWKHKILGRRERNEMRDRELRQGKTWGIKP